MSKSISKHFLLVSFLLCSALNPTYAQKKGAYDYYYSAKIQMEKQNYSIAISLFDSAEMEGIDIYDLYNNRGICYYNLGQYKVALQNYKRILDATMQYPNAIINAANAEYKLGYYAESEKKAIILLKQKTFEKYAYNTLGNIFYDKRMYQEAKTQYENAIRYGPELPSPYFNMGNTCYELKQYDSAISWHLKCRELAPGDLENLNSLSRAYSMNRQIDDAIKICYEVLARDSFFYKAYAQIAFCFMDNPNYNPDEVIPFLEKAISIEPRKALYVYDNLGIAYLRKGMHHKVLEYHTKAIEINPRNVKSYSGRGDIYRDSAQYEKAIHDYMMAIYLDSSYNYPNMTLGALMIRLHEFDKAEKYFERYYQLTPDLKKATVAINTTKAYNYVLTGDYKTAILSANITLSIDPENAYSLNNKGMALAKLGELDSAFYYFNKSAQIDPYNSYVFHNRAYAYVMAGKNVEACIDLNHALNLNYPIRVDSMLLLLNQRICKLIFESPSDSLHVNLKQVMEKVQESKMIAAAFTTREEFEGEESLTGVNNINSDKLDILQQLFPNPASEEFTIQLKGRLGKPVQANIIGMNGQNARQFNFTDIQKSNFNISCRDWPAGTYYILLISENQAAGNGKIVVTH
ncbi:MAG: tetratricopeptide repeat protein [Bacteroidota bacterium]|nr:tetratricopeptide repeat protein [Bacteroidota bacterium]